MKRLLAITAALWLLCPLTVPAGSTGWGHGLIDPVVDGTSCNLRVLGFGTLTEAADAPGNPDNRILDIKGRAAEIDLRPDFSLDLNRLQLSLQPRLDARWEAWTTGIHDGASQTDADIYIYQWLARWQATYSLFVSYGRENLQWGPAYLTSLSNPFFTDNGKENPKLEVDTTDFARAVWVPNLTWSVSLIGNTDAGRQSMPGRDFSRRCAIKLDYTGTQDYGSLILGGDEDGSRSLGGFYGRTLSDALLAYAEGALWRHPFGRYAEPADNPLGLAMSSGANPGQAWIGAFLIGGSYTLAAGPTLTAEYLYYGPGYDDAAAERYSDLQERAAQAVEAGGALSALGTGELFAAAAPGLRFLRQHYLMLQFVHNDMAEVFDLTLRWTRNLDDRSSRLTTIGEWHGGDHLRIFGIATVNRGDRRSEFRRIFDYQLMAGIEYDF
jgi:hypothetical protein